MLAGSRFVKAGYQSFWGPGRHKFGSNWFWYFNSPLGCHVEYDADMDLHDDEWTPRETPMSPEAVAGLPVRASREMGARRPAAWRGRPAAVRRRDRPRFSAGFDELRDGEARGFGPFDGGRTKAFVVRPRRRGCFAYWDACPHYGDTPMAWRTNAYLECGRRPHRLRLARRGVRDRDGAMCRRRGSRPVPVAGADRDDAGGRSRLRTDKATREE